MELYTNSIIERITESAKVRSERILWFDQIEDQVVTIDIDDPKAWPAAIAMSELQADLDCGDAAWFRSIPMPH